MKRKEKIDISIIIPIYNESENVEILYQEISEVFAATNRTYEVVFVDDCSSDQSLDKLTEIASSDRRVKVIEFQRNFGQTAAVSAGIEESVGEVIIPMDGDLQNDPADIPKLIEKLEEGYSVVSGWRKKRKDAFVRVLPSKIANWVISWAMRVKIHDNGCALKAYRREVIEGVQLYGEMHRFITVYAAWSGGKITEIEVNHRPRIYGKSKYGFSRVIKVILDLLVVRFLHSYINRPIHFFGKYGFYSILFAGLFFLWSIYLKLFLDISISRTPLPIFAVMFVVVGIQLVLSGVLAELMMRTYYESQSKKPYIIKKIQNGEEKNSEHSPIKSNKKLVLVTGGAGYVGSVLVPKLLAQGFRVKVVDDLIYNQKNDLVGSGNPDIDFVKADLRDDYVIKEAVKGVDYIVHLAALVGENVCRDNPGLSYQLNLGLVEKINKVRKDTPTVFMSTTSIYGETDGRDCSETSEPGPYLPYALNKLGAEKIIIKTNNYIILRPATAFGYSPRTRLDLLPNEFTYKAIHNHFLEVYNPNVQRTFIHVSDLADVITKMISNFDSLKNEIYNVGHNSMNLSKQELAEKIKTKIDYRLKIIDNYNDPDKRNFTVNYDKLINAIGFKPKYDVSLGIDEMIAKFENLKDEPHLHNDSRSIKDSYNSG